MKHREEITPKINQTLIRRQESETYGAVENFRGTMEDLKDYLFNEYMKQQLLEFFFESLKDYFHNDDIDAVKKLFTEFSEKDIIAALSLPYELRERKLSEFSERMDAGEEITDIFRDFITTSAKYKFGIGFHTSPVDIPPDAHNRWSIKGTEADHRDNDVLMAYYSSQYRHLFRRRHPKYIYIVRTEPNTHRTDGNWSRAPSLSIIDRVPFENVVRYVENTANKISAEPNEGPAA